MARKTLLDTLRARFDQVIQSDPDSAMEFLLTHGSGSNNQTVEVEAEEDEPTPILLRKALGKVVKTNVRKTRERFATVAYQAKRNRAGNVTGEAKRPADQAAWKFLIRHRKPVTILELEQATGLTNSQLRNNLYRMQREGILETVKLNAE